MLAKSGQAPKSVVRDIKGLLRTCILLSLFEFCSYLSLSHKGKIGHWRIKVFAKIVSSPGSFADCFLLSKFTFPRTYDSLFSSCY